MVKPFRPPTTSPEPVTQLCLVLSPVQLETACWHLTSSSWLKFEPLSRTQGSSTSAEQLWILKCCALIVWCRSSAEHQALWG